jgi:hypothetical protein
MNPTASDALVFFGATGDLAYKKIFPALQSMVKRGRLRESKASGVVSGIKGVGNQTGRESFRPPKRLPTLPTPLISHVCFFICDLSFSLSNSFQPKPGQDNSRNDRAD